MKKGLLSVLAFAMVLVGCQNYDDQFDSLNDQISTLATQLNGTDAAIASQAAGFTTQVASLQAQLDALTSSLADDIAALEAQGVSTADAIAANAATASEQASSTAAAIAANAATASEQASSTAAALAANAAAIAANAAASSEQASSTAAAIAANAAAIAAIQTALDNAATAEDLDSIEEDIDQLLEQTAVTDGPLRLTTVTELEYVQSLGDFTRVRGNLTVDVTDEELRDSIAAVNAILSRIRIIIDGDITLTGHESATYLDASALVSVGKDLKVYKKKAMLGALQSVNEDLELNYNGGYDFPNLTVVKNITLTDNASNTMVNFPDVTSDGGYLSTGSDGGVATFKYANSVVLGDINVKELTADKATTVTLGYDAATTTHTTISAKAPGSMIKVSFLGRKTDNIMITGSATSTVYASKLKYGKYVSITGETVNTDALATVAGKLEIHEAKAVSLPELTAVGSITTMDDATSVYAPKWALTTTAAFAVATTIAIKSGSVSLTTKNVVKKLTIGALANGVTFNVNNFAALETLDIKGVKADAPAAGAQTNVVTASGSSLEDLTVSGYLKALTLVGNQSLESIDTSGNIIDVKVMENGNLETIAFGHTFVPTDNAPTIYITKNAKLTSVDMKSVAKVKTLTVSGNIKLTSISVAPSDADNLVSSGADVSYTVLNNGLVGSYTAAVSATETDPYAAPKIVQKDLAAIKALIDAYNEQESRATSPTFNLSFDDDGDTKTHTDSDTLIWFLDDDTNAHAGINKKHENGLGDDDSDNGFSTSGTTSGTGSGINTANELANLTAEAQTETRN